jgi:hypothetical protein
MILGKKRTMIHGDNFPPIATGARQRRPASHSNPGRKQPGWPQFVFWSSCRRAKCPAPQDFEKKERRIGAQKAHKYAAKQR